MENVDNIVLENLKKFQGGQDRIERKLEAVSPRLANLEAGQASIIQHIVQSSNTSGIWHLSKHSNRCRPTISGSVLSGLSDDWNFKAKEAANDHMGGFF